MEFRVKNTEPGEGRFMGPYKNSVLWLRGINGNKE